MTLAFENVKKPSINIDTNVNAVRKSRNKSLLPE